MSVLFNNWLSKQSGVWCNQECRWMNYYGDYRCECDDVDNCECGSDDTNLSKRELKHLKLGKCNCKHNLTNNDIFSKKYKLFIDDAYVPVDDKDWILECFDKYKQKMRENGYNWCRQNNCWLYQGGDDGGCNVSNDCSTCNCDSKYPLMTDVMIDEFIHNNDDGLSRYIWKYPNNHGDYDMDEYIKIAIETLRN